MDKPAGITSFDVIRRLRKQLHIKKAGHCGTLDKWASGLLVICTGRTTKLATFLIEGKKEYTGTVVLGTITDTCDADGEVLETRDVPDEVFDEVSKIPVAFSGKIQQVPPRYSALKIEGKRASDRVRGGEELEMKPRPVEIHSLVIEKVDIENRTLQIRVICSKGTYIRSLARDIGEMLGTGAYLAELRRTRSGKFKVEQAVTPDQLDLMLENGELNGEFVIPADRAIDDFGSVVVSDNRAEKVPHGAPIYEEDVEEVTGGDGKYYRVVSRDGELLAVAELHAHPFRVKYRHVFSV
ncbi:MAG: tRNA pseudouridine(55) synthase TruB [Spirochaetota bacterium]